MKSVQIWSFSGLYLPAFGPKTDQKKLWIRTLSTQCKLIFYLTLMPLLRKLVVQIEIADLQKILPRKTSFMISINYRKIYYQPLQLIATKYILSKQSVLHENTWKGIIKLFKGTSLKFPRILFEKIYYLTYSFLLQ